MTAPPPELPLADVRVKRRAWPMLASAGALVVVLVTAFFVWRRHEAQKQLEDTYPVVPSPSDRVLLSHEAKAWAKGRKQLLATLATFDPWDVRVARDAAPCSIAQSVSTQSQIDDANTDRSSVPDSFGDMIAGSQDPDSSVDDRLIAEGGLHARATAQVEQMLTAARRGRFRTLPGRAAVVSAISHDALVVLELTDDVAPEIARDGDKPAFYAGHRAGKAYAFDRETGELRCAGAFDTSSSTKVTVLESVGMGLGNEHDSIRRDFEAQTDRAIASALRVVAKPGEKAPAVGMAEYDFDRETPEKLENDKLYQQACDNGELDACRAIAEAMEKGSVAYDAKKHIALLSNACNGGEMPACSMLANAYLLGRGVPFDANKAVALYEKGCAAKYGFACELLGLMAQQGKGIAVDQERAVGYFQRGCDAGDSQSCADLGTHYLGGTGVALSYAHAVEAFEKACNGKLPSSNACVSLAAIYGQGKGIPKDMQKALEYARLACSLEDPDGCAIRDELSQQDGTQIGN